jgi:hypothetical protein
MQIWNPINDNVITQLAGTLVAITVTVTGCSLDALTDGGVLLTLFYVQPHVVA